MRIAILIGLLTIAEAINPELFTDTLVIYFAVTLTVLLAMDILDFTRKVDK
jgi:hypothetical protein